MTALRQRVHFKDTDVCYISLLAVSGISPASSAMCPLACNSQPHVAFRAGSAVIVQPLPIGNCLAGPPRTCDVHEDAKCDSRPRRRRFQAHGRLWFRVRITYGEVCSAAFYLDSHNNLTKIRSQTAELLK